MKDFFNNILAKSKQSVMPILCTLIGLYFVYYLCNVIVGSATSSVFGMIIWCGIFALMLILWLAKKEGLFNLCFTLFFAWKFVNCLINLPSSLTSFGSEVLLIFVAIFSLLIVLGTLGAGVFYILDRSKGTSKYLSVINIIVLALIILCVLNFILFLIAACVYSYVYWPTVFSYLTNAGQILFFCAVINKDKDYPVVKKEKKAKNKDKKKSEARSYMKSLKEEDKDSAETEGKEVATEEKTEERSEVKEEVVDVPAEEKTEEKKTAKKSTKKSTSKKK